MAVFSWVDLRERHRPGMAALNIYMDGDYEKTLLHSRGIY